MNLQNLIEQEKLKQFQGASINQIQKRFGTGVSYFDLAKKIFNEQREDEDFNMNIYTNIYDAIRITGEALLLLHELKAVIKDHHKIVLQAVKIIMNSSEMEELFLRLDKMRKKRNLDLYSGGFLISVKESNEYLQFVRCVIKATQQYLKSQRALF